MHSIQEHFLFIDYLESWVQIPKKSNIQKNGWKKRLAVMKESRLLLYNSEKDQQAAVSIDVKYETKLLDIMKQKVLRSKVKIDLDNVYFIVNDNECKNSIPIVGLPK